MNLLLKAQITLEPFHMAFLFIIPVILLLGSLSRTRKRAPYPPGPKGMPVIGKENDILTPISYPFLLHYLVYENKK